MIRNSFTVRPTFCPVQGYIRRNTFRRHDHVKQQNDCDALQTISQGFSIPFFFPIKDDVDSRQNRHRQITPPLRHLLFPGAMVVGSVQYLLQQAPEFLPHGYENIDRNKQPFGKKDTNCHRYKYTESLFHWNNLSLHNCPFLSMMRHYSSCYKNVFGVLKSYQHTPFIPVDSPFRYPDNS